MSEGYASRLSDYPKKGICGLPEVFDSKRAILVKVKRLVELMENAKQVVVITGAGISTEAGIPDFRGPKGIWTLEQEQQQRQQQNDNNDDDKSTTTSRKRKRQQRPAHYQRPMPEQLENFADAKPTLCHRAITKLVMENKIKYVVTQNVDGLHKRAGLPRDKHCSVHGCVFTEKCGNDVTCGAEFFRDFDVGGMSFQPTGRKCTVCEDGILKDTLLDWEDPLPQQDLDRAYQEVETPGTLVLCLGTSLRIQPIGDLPLSATNFVIINLQKTPIDDQAALIIRGTTDDILNELMIQLGLSKWQEEPHFPIERVWQPPNKNKKRKTESKKEKQS